MQFALAGASTIIITGRNITPLEETKTIVQAATPSCTILPISADAIDETSVQKLFDRLPGTPDVLINNAGVSMSRTSIVDSSIDLWWSDWVRLICFLAKASNLEQSRNFCVQITENILQGNQCQRPLPFHTFIFASTGWKTWDNSQRVFKRL